MGLFDGTIDFYRQYRPGIPAIVADVLDAAVPDCQPRRLLDVGTGTGLVVEALLGRFDDIIAIDSDPGMLAAAEDVLRPQLPADAQLRLQWQPPRSDRPVVDLAHERVRRRPVLGGLINEYERAA